MRRFKKRTVYFAGFAAFAAISTAAYAAATSTKITTNSSISSRGVHKVPVNAPKDGKLDPRAEAFFIDKVTSNSNESWSFKATYFITSAKRTTITQLLQTDPSQPGANQRKPVMFLTATKQSNGKYFICNGNSSSATSCSTAEWTNVPQSFTIEMSGTGKSASVKINGTTKTVSLIKTPSGENRKNGSLELRWGAYHHDVSNNKAASTAQVRVYNIKETGFD